jgi:hypothetical protein
MQKEALRVGIYPLNREMVFEIQLKLSRCSGNDDRARIDPFSYNDYALAHYS